MKLMRDETMGRRSAAMTGEQCGRFRLLGLPVDLVDMGGAVEHIAGYIEAWRGGDGSGQPLECGGAGRITHQVVTLNPEMVMAAQRDRELRDAILNADLVVADGAGVVWAARLSGEALRLRARVTGVDLLDACAGLAAARGYRLFLLGAAEGVAGLAAARLEARHPGLHIAGTFAGSPAPVERGDICARIREAGADIVFVAYGSPAQERWIAGARGELGAAAAVGVGGAFDFMAGRVERAPRWMRRCGLEWLYRLWREPWRWRRMLALPRFALAVLRAKTSRMRSKRSLWRLLSRRRTGQMGETE